MTGDPHRKFSFRDTEVCGNLNCPNQPESGPFVLEVAADGDEIEAVHAGPDGARVVLEVLSFDGDTC